MSINLIEVCFAFFEGLTLISSPCILPILPLVLAGSLESGRRRPYGIILGFISAFTLFALISRQLVMALHLNLDYIKYISLLLLCLFGLILLSEKLSLKFFAKTQSIANFSAKLSNHAKGGFSSGIFLGILIGLVWTPCAGPILAIVLVQIIRQQSDLQALFLIFAFACGAGLPMLIISLLGKSILESFDYFRRRAKALRKILGLIIIASALFIASGLDFRIWEEKSERPIGAQSGLLYGLTQPYMAPDFSGIDKWYNSQPLTIKALRGKVVLIDFWTYSCINCLRTLPYVIEWDRKYRSKGLVIIGVHAPEFEFEKNPENVHNAIMLYKISYPVALDNYLDTWTNFANLFWPAHYLIDKSGRIVYTHFGEGEFEITENNIRYLLGLNKISEKTETGAYGIPQTPETYLGSLRSSNYNSNLQTLPLNNWGLIGKWRFEGQRIIAEKAGAKLRLHFIAKKVFLVMGAKDKAVTVKINLNGKSIGRLTVTQHKLYSIVEQQSSKEGILELTIEAPGLEAYAFTFGN